MTPRIHLALALAVLALLPVPGWTQSEKLDVSAVRRLPMLDGGRVKPFDTYARETVRFLTGSEVFKGHDPVRLLLDLGFNSKKWNATPLLSLGFRPLTEQLLLPPNTPYVSAADLGSNREYEKLIAEIRRKEIDTDKLPRLEREAVILFHKATLLDSQTDGRAWKLVPAESDPQAAWSGLGESKLAAVKGAAAAMADAWRKEDPAAFDKAVADLSTSLRAATKLPYPEVLTLDREVWYHRFRPFEKAGICYAAAFIGFLVSVLTVRRRLYAAGLTLALVGFGLHAYGLALRALISGRAPVSNVYETLLFVPFGVCLFALILELVYRGRYIGLMSSAMAAGILLISDFVSLDPYVSPLVPVLRSNYWLIIHVLTITLGYAAATLGLGLGHLWLGVFIVRGADSMELKNIEEYLYHVIRVAVLFIGVGIVLGGVWANQSWGRYWGWDPKETWALISLLAFLAVVHARIVNVIGGFGTAVGTILAWQCVFFCWYGVNYFLTGLHSYAGGDQATHVPWPVYAWATFELGFLAASFLAHRAHVKRLAA